MKPLDDRWTSRDLPVLVEVARRLEAGESVVTAQGVAAELTQWTDEDISAALDSLEDSTPPFIRGGRTAPRGGRSDLVVTGLTERGRRAVGVWPSAEGVDALVEALRQAEESTEDAEERTLLRRAAGAVGSVSRDIMVDVVASVVARQSGIG